jgi:multidrug efflux pump
MNLMPPAIEELGTSSGFSMRLQDRANQGFGALMKAQDPARDGCQDPAIAMAYPEGLPPAAASAWTSTARRPRRWAFPSPASATPCPRPWARCTSTTFPNAGRMQQVIIQADARRACRWRTS